MGVFRHHIYEFEKGLRNLILHTISIQDKSEVLKILRERQIAYLISPAGKDFLNVFFGHQDCIEVIKAIGKEKLCDFSAEEDFILGTMLGYDRLIQCRRFLQMKAKEQVKAQLA